MPLVLERDQYTRQKGGQEDFLYLARASLLQRLLRLRSFAKIIRRATKPVTIGFGRYRETTCDF